MRKYLPLFLLTTLSGLCVSAQKKIFLPGFYIQHNGDTVRGFGFIEGNNKINTFQFKEDPNSTKALQIAALDCKEISFGKETYVSWYGKRSLEYVSGNDLYTVNRQGEFVTDSIVIKLLYQGKGFALYQFKSERNHFFIEANDRIDELMISYVYFDNNSGMDALNYQKGMYFTRKTYQSQIFSLLNNKIDTRKKSVLLWDTSFEKHSLVKLFKQLDQ